jgi:hypothetical protein
MSADSPPTYYFTGIDFNSSFYTTPSGGSGDLTLAQANALYLRKTIPDIATAVETFSAGIKTDAIDTNTVGALTIGGTNANAITLSKPTTASGTLAVTGILSANNSFGLKTNKIEPLSTIGNDIIIGSTISATNSVSIGKTTGGLGVSFPSGLLTNSINNVGTNDIVIGSTIAVSKKVAIGKNDGSGLPVEFPSGLTTLNDLAGVRTLKVNAPVGQSLFIADDDTSFGGIFIGNGGSTVTVGTLFGFIDTTLVDDTTGAGVLYIGYEASSLRLSTKYDPTEVIPYTAYIETSSTLTSNTINFHSNADFETTYDSRIIASGGTVNDGEGNLEIEAETVYITNPDTIEIGKEVVGVNPASTTALRGLLNLTNGLGTAGQVLTSGGSGGSLTWATASGGGSFQSGSFVPTYSSTASVASPVFGTTFTTTLPPTVLLTCDVGTGSTNIVIPCVAGFQGSAGAWTGFYYLLSASGATNLNYFAS